MTRGFAGHGGNTPMPIRSKCMSTSALTGNVRPVPAKTGAAAGRRLIRRSALAVRISGSLVRTLISGHLARIFLAPDSAGMRQTGRQRSPRRGA